MVPAVIDRPVPSGSLSWSLEPNCRKPVTVILPVVVALLTTMEALLEVGISVLAKLECSSQAPLMPCTADPLTVKAPAETFKPAPVKSVI